MCKCVLNCNVPISNDVKGNKTMGQISANDSEYWRGKKKTLFDYWSLKTGKIKQVKYLNATNCLSLSITEYYTE